MTALVVVGCIVGYLLCGVAVTRACWLILVKPVTRNGRIDDTDGVKLFFSCICWPVALTLALLITTGYGMWRLASIPTRKERLEARHARLQKRIAELEREFR